MTSNKYIKWLRCSWNANWNQGFWIGCDLYVFICAESGLQTYVINMDNIQPTFIWRAWLLGTIQWALIPITGGNQHNQHVVLRCHKVSKLPSRGLCEDIDSHTHTQTHTHCCHCTGAPTAVAQKYSTVGGWVQHFLVSPVLLKCLLRAQSWEWDWIIGCRNWLNFTTYTFIPLWTCLRTPLLTEDISSTSATITRIKGCW